MCEYFSDVLRNIKKFDIYTCDFGEHPGLTTLGKARPCVIVQSDDLNCPISKSFVVAPIRSEHAMDVNDEKDAKECVDMRKGKGALYVPIKVNKRDKDMISFIDITQIRQVDSSKLDKYVGQIVKPELRMQINKMLMQLLFDVNEVEEILLSEDDVEIEEEVHNDEVEQSDDSSTGLPAPTDTEIGRKINAAIAEQSKANEQKVRELYKQVQNKQISKSSAAHKLGLTIKAFDQMTKDMKKEEKEKKSPSKYSTRSLPKTLPSGFSLLYKHHKDGKMTVKEMSKKLGKSEQTCYNYIARYEQLQNENKVTSV